jgi:hypothetical protein
MNHHTNLNAQYTRLEGRCQNEAGKITNYRTDYSLRPAAPRNSKEPRFGMAKTIDAQFIRYQKWNKGIAASESVYRAEHCSKVARNYTENVLDGPKLPRALIAESGFDTLMRQESIERPSMSILPRRGTPADLNVASESFERVEKFTSRNQ